ncbi:hypothetical protein ZWY2020_058078 [Hordeum vulgare]|nr:hypothetical protein ZWY2020_058078 [Hordeum vulgare]
MDGHNGGGAGAGAGKLTRTPSSLLRSPTVRNCSSFQAVLVEDPEPDDKQSQAAGAQRKALHPHAGPAHPALILALSLGLLLLRDDLHLLLRSSPPRASSAAACGCAAPCRPAPCSGSSATTTTSRTTPRTLGARPLPRTATSCGRASSSTAMGTATGSSTRAAATAAASTTSSTRASPILDEASHVANKFVGERSADFAGARRSSAEHSNAACFGYTRGMYHTDREPAGFFPGYCNMFVTCLLPRLLQDGSEASPATSFPDHL